MEAVRTYIRDRVTVQDCGHATPCWLWSHCTRDGYGRAHIGGRIYQAHRISCEAFNGEIPAGLEVDHLCCVANCVNPDHLEPVTSEENLRRKAIRRGYIIGGKVRMPRARPAPGPPRTHCAQGHEFAGENLLIECGFRRCRTCKRKSQNRTQRDRRAAAREFLEAGRSRKPAAALRDTHTQTSSVRTSEREHPTA